MTSINALRLNHDSGLLLCDEARYWNSEWMIFYTPEKIRRVVSEKMMKNHKTVLFMGQTGSSSIGDEWISEVTREHDSNYNAAIKTGRSDADRYVRLKNLARQTFDTITRIKHVHIDDFLQGKFGFNGRDLIRGYYQDSEKGKVSISDSDLISDALKYMTFSDSSEEVKGIFGNSQVLAGYNPEDGFKIFYMTERWPVCEEVHEIFIAQGSGRDTCDLNYAGFADKCSLKQRRQEVDIDRATGLFALLKGLNQALKQTAGIGGYPKIIYVNGKESSKSDWVKEISDCRSKLALEMVSASMAGFISQKKCEELLEELIFQGKEFFTVNDSFLKQTTDEKAVLRYLRNYS